MNLDFVVAAVEFERVGDVGSLAALGKHAFAAFGYEFYAHSLEKAHRRTVRELRKCDFQKFGIRPHILCELALRFGIGQIAPSLARDSYFACGLLHLFEQQNARTVLRSRSRRHHSGSTGTYDYYVVLGFGSFYQIFHICNKVTIKNPQMKFSRRKNGCGVVRTCPKRDSAPCFLLAS